MVHWSICCLQPATVWLHGLKKNLAEQGAQREKSTKSTEKSLFTNQVVSSSINLSRFSLNLSWNPSANATAYFRRLAAHDSPKVTRQAISSICSKHSLWPNVSKWKHHLEEIRNVMAFLSTWFFKSNIIQREPSPRWDWSTSLITNICKLQHLDTPEECAVSVVLASTSNEAIHFCTHITHCGSKFPSKFAHASVIVMSFSRYLKLSPHLDIPKPMQIWYTPQWVSKTRYKRHALLALFERAPAVCFQLMKLTPFNAGQVFQGILSDTISHVAQKFGMHPNLHTSISNAHKGLPLHPDRSTAGFAATPQLGEFPNHSSLISGWASEHLHARLVHTHSLQILALATNNSWNDREHHCTTMVSENNLIQNSPFSAG